MFFNCSAVLPYFPAKIKLLNVCVFFYHFLFKGKRPGATKVVFLVTDGQSNIESSMTIPNANLLKNAGVEIFVVAVGNYISGIEELVKVASPDPKEHVFRVANMSSFLNVTELAFDLVVPRLSQFIASHYQPLCN